MPILFVNLIAIGLIVLFYVSVSRAKESGLYTPYTFPVPDDLRCWSNYLSLQYICDPDQLLYLTDAKKIDKFFNYDKFSGCPSSSPSNDDDQYIVGLALAATMHQQNKSIFLDGCKQQRHFKNASSHSFVKKIDESIVDEILNDIASVLLTRWSSPHLPNNNNEHNFDNYNNNINNRNNNCHYDVLVIITNSLIFCYADERTIISDRPLVGIGYSQRLQRLLALERRTSALKMLKPTRDGSSLLSTVPLVIGSLQMLDRIVPYAWDETSSGDEDAILLEGAFKSDNNSSRLRGKDNVGKPKRYPPHIPTWALIVFLVCLTLTFVCTALGHWVNTGDSRGRFTSSDKLFFARGHSNDRRWRAGFAGGMMDVHAQGRAPGGGGGSRGGGGKAKGKMFGAMAMGNKKANSAQYNYQRV